MRARWLPALWCLAAAVACRDRRRPPTDTAPARDAPVARPYATRDGGVSDTMVPAPGSVAPRAWLRVERVTGAVTLDSTLRLRVDGPDGVTTRPGGGAPARGATDTGAGMYPGDVLATGPDGGATVRVTAGAVPGAVALGPEATVEVPGYGGAVTVLTRGVADVSAPADPVRVDTPAGRVIVAGGTATVGVALDGSVAVHAESGVVTLWPSPPAPAARSTRLTRAEIARRRAVDPSHPVLLDVDLPELAAMAVRPVASHALPAGDTAAWDPLGDTHGRPPPAHAPRAALVRWVAAVNAAVASPGAHLVAIARVGRAGAGDLADARAATARLRAAGSTLAPRDRGELASALSLALGRATARARRGRELAARGGDVTALVQLAPTEDLCAAARPVLPMEP